MGDFTRRVMPEFLISFLKISLISEISGPYFPLLDEAKRGRMKKVARYRRERSQRGEKGKSKTSQDVFAWAVLSLSFGMLPRRCSAILKSQRSPSATPQSARK